MTVKNFDFQGISLAILAIFQGKVILMEFPGILISRGEEQAMVVYLAV